MNVRGLHNIIKMPLSGNNTAQGLFGMLLRGNSYEPVPLYFRAPRIQNL